MSKLFQINSGIVGSTGMIMLEIDKCAQAYGMKTYMASVNNKSSRSDYPSNHFVIGGILEKHLHRQIAAITGNEGNYSKAGTRAILKKIDEIQPDIIQLHNLHWDYINLSMLFDFLKTHTNIKIVWTLHDCWAYTGHCPYYDMIKCDLWKTECHDCKVYRQYPKSFVDNSTKMHRRKKQWFTGLPNLTLVTPSKWLYDEVSKSFLNTYPRVIINNGIDTNSFKYTNSEFRNKYEIENKFVIMGSAYVWGERKGFDAFIKLSEMVDDNFKIIMIGGFNADQLETCKKNGIIALPRTSSKKELAELYSTSDVFFNPTREEMFGLVNIEAQACGTPVITFRSGGSPECIGKGCGYIVDKEDMDAVMKCISELRMKGKPPYHVMRQWAEQFSTEKIYNQYVELYFDLLG